MALSINNTNIDNLTVDGVAMQTLTVDGTLVFDNSPIAVADSGQFIPTTSPYTFTVPLNSYVVVSFGAGESVTNSYVSINSVALDDITTGANSILLVFGGTATGTTCSVSWTSASVVVGAWVALTNTDGVTSSITTTVTGNDLDSATSTKSGSFFLNVGRANNRGDQCAEAPLNLTIAGCQYRAITGSWTNDSTYKMGYQENLANGGTTGLTNPGTLFDNMNGYMFLRK